MKSTAKKNNLEIIVRGGKPAAVILNIKDYQEILERLEDLEDAAMLRKLRKKPLKIKNLDDFLKEYKPCV